MNSENDDMDTRTGVSEHTSRMSRQHTRKNAGEQLEMISAMGTGQMSGVPTSALTWRMINASASALER